MCLRVHQLHALRATRSRGCLWLHALSVFPFFFFFFFNDPPPPDFSPFPPHAPLPICQATLARPKLPGTSVAEFVGSGTTWFGLDRKSTRLNSSHLVISYAVFCLK